MSNIMWNDPKVKIDYRNIVVWDDNNIKGFFGSEDNEYRWLSNFEPCKVYFEGLKYPSSEAAYMAAKTLDKNLRNEFTVLSAHEAKKLGRLLVLRDNWDSIKYDIMLRIIFEKFASNILLKKKLIETGDKYLEELNFWRDIYWGVDYKLGGQNKLGEILMKVRSILK